MARYSGSGCRRNVFVLWWIMLCFCVLCLCTSLEGIPHDGTIQEEVVTVHLSVTVLIVILAAAGLVFTIVCLVFNFVFREKT